MAPCPRPVPRPRLTGNPPNHAVGNRQAANPPPLEKDVDRVAKKLGDKYTRAVNRTIRTTIPDGHQQQCEEYVGVVHVYKALLVDVYAHLVYCEYRDNHEQHPLLNKLQQSVSIWQSWDRLKQLTHHVKIRDALYGYLEPYCQKHRHLFLFRSRVPAGDRDGILSLIVHCAKAQETAFFDLAYKMQIQEYDDRKSWKESDVVVDLIYLCLIGLDTKPIFRERLLSHTLRLATKSAYFPRSLAIDFGQIILSEYAFPRGRRSSAGRQVGRYENEDVDVEWLTFYCDQLRSRFRKAFSSEAILWSTLQHENIVPFYGVITRPGSPCRLGLVFKFMPNRTITDCLREPCVNRKKLAVDIAKALKYIHNLKPPVYHGHLDRDHIVVDQYGHAHLTDFSRATHCNYIQSLATILPRNRPFYLAPEHLGPDYDVRTTSYSDMWSFGCVLYELITGSMLFEDLGVPEISNRIRHGHMPTRPRDLEPEISAWWPVVESCWHLDPNRRLSARKAVEKLS